MTYSPIAARNTHPTRQLDADPEPARERQSHPSQPSWVALVVSLAAVLSLLVADGILREPGQLDYRVMNAIQSIDFPYAGQIMRGVRDLVMPLVGLAIWAVALAAFAVSRRWLPALATLIVPIPVAVGTLLVKLLIDLPRPDPAKLHRVVGDVGLGAFWSAEIVGAVLLLGLLYFVSRGFENRYARLGVQAPAALLIAVAGVAELWLGTAFPTGVLAGYAIGGALLVGLLWVYQRIEFTCGDIPFIHAAKVPHDETATVAHALTSTIIFDEDTVSKVYAPGFVPRAIYWLAFQAEFPYIRNRTALRAAVQRRNLAGMLTEYWFGENRVARAIRVDEFDGRFALVSERIHGGSPKDRDAARMFLFDLADRFDAAGLPTWQVDPRQPRAMDNIIEDRDGRYHIIDLESGLVSPLASPRAWFRAFRRGLVPIYDDVYFDITREYVEREHARMVGAMGARWTDELLALIDEAEDAANEWRDSEPRVWSRLLGARRHRTTADSEKTLRAQRWFYASIASWEADSRITHAEAERLREATREPQFVAVLPHFGVHLAIGVLLRFPIGSIVRASYTLLNLLLATLRLAVRAIDRRRWKQLAGIHSPLVVLFAAMPGVGTFAYLASRPIRSNHLLLRVAMDAVLVKFPWRIYERTGLRWVIARPVVDGLADEDDARPLRVPVWPQSIVLILGLLAGALFALDILTQLADRILAPDVIGWPQAMRVLDLNAEASLGSWFSVISLAALALALAAVAFAKHVARDRWTRHWLILAILALGLSLDEQAKFHDSDGGDRVREVISLSGPVFYGWVLVGLASVTIVALIYRGFLADLPRTTRRLFTLAAALYVGGELVLESLSGWIADRTGSESSLLYQTVTSFEELLGMIGVVVAIAAVLHYIQHELGEVRIIMSDHALSNGVTPLAEPGEQVGLIGQARQGASAGPRTVKVTGSELGSHE